MSPLNCNDIIGRVLCGGMAHTFLDDASVAWSAPAPSSPKPCACAGRTIRAKSSFVNTSFTHSVSLKGLCMLSR